MEHEPSAEPSLESTRFPWRATAVRGLGSVDLGLGGLCFVLAAVYGVLLAGEFPTSTINTQTLFFSMLLETSRYWREIELDPYLGVLDGRATLSMFSDQPFYEAYMGAMLALHLGLSFLLLRLGPRLRRLDRRAMRVQGVLAAAAIGFAWLTLPKLGAAIATIPLAGAAALNLLPIRGSADPPSKQVVRSHRTILTAWTLAVVLIPLALILVEIGMVQVGIFIHYWRAVLFDA